MYYNQDVTIRNLRNGTGAERRVHHGRYSYNPSIIPIMVNVISYLICKLFDRKFQW